MVKIKKYANVIERFLHGEKGQRFFNFAYSIGAAIVIWGALFKILHLPGGSTLLCIGMGTEIAMFILTAFDRPPREYNWEEVFPQFDKHGEGHAAGMPQINGGVPQGGYVGGGVVVQGGGYTGGYVGPAPQGAAPAQPEEGAEFAPAEGGYVPATAAYAPANPAADAATALGLTEEDTDSLRDSISKMATVADQLEAMSGVAEASQNFLRQMSAIADQMSQLSETTQALNRVSESLLGSYQAVTGKAGEEASSGYAEQMEDLTRNISGLNTIYAIQLKSVSSQLESIDRVNRGLKDIRDMYEKSASQSSRYCEETERMARYMKQLNSVYEKMITAMTINMANPMMGGGMASANQDVNPFANSQNND